jgi:hypothetical protein
MVRIFIGRLIIVLPLVFLGVSAEEYRFASAIAVAHAINHFTQIYFHLVEETLTNLVLPSVFLRQYHERVLCPALRHPKRPITGGLKYSELFVPSLGLCCI